MGGREASETIFHDFILEIPHCPHLRAGPAVLFGVANVTDEILGLDQGATDTNCTTVYKNEGENIFKNCANQKTAEDHQTSSSISLLRRLHAYGEGDAKTAGVRPVRIRGALKALRVSQTDRELNEQSCAELQLSVCHRLTDGELSEQSCAELRDEVFICDRELASSAGVSRRAVRATSMEVARAAPIVDLA
ncbi:hypothetical protein Bbelb_118090 [Branchiostoma belcheri]|nr:hypothetical protein Bbelb_118090 [Branchiostoma belcheri]